VTCTGWNGQACGANQQVSLDDAIKINTINVAYNACEEAIKGSINPGKLTELGVLAFDLHSEDGGKIKDIPIKRTVAGGSTVYQA
jgi:predicted amidohydrolase YtcJ